VTSSIPTLGSTPTVPVPTTIPSVTGPNPHTGPIDTGIPVIDDTLNALVAALVGLLRGIGGG